MDSRASMVTRRAFMGALPAPNLGRGTHIGTAFAWSASFPARHVHRSVPINKELIAGISAESLAIAAKSLAKSAKEYANV